MSSVAAIILCAFVAQAYAKQLRAIQANKLVSKLASRATKVTLLQYPDLDSITLAKPGGLVSHSRPWASGHKFLAHFYRVPAYGSRLLAPGFQLPASRARLPAHRSRISIPRSPFSSSRSMPEGAPDSSEKEWQAAFNTLLSQDGALRSLAEMALDGFNQLGRGAIIANYPDEAQQQAEKTEVSTEYVPLKSWREPARGVASQTLISQIETYIPQSSFVFVVVKSGNMGGSIVETQVFEKLFEERLSKSIGKDEFDERLAKVLSKKPGIE